MVNPSNANFHPKHKNPKIFENHRNPVMSVFIWMLSPSSFVWVPILQGSSIFFRFLPDFVLAKLATSRLRVKHELVNGRVTKLLRRVWRQHAIRAIYGHHADPFRLPNDGYKWSWQHAYLEWNERLRLNAIRKLLMGFV